MDIVRFKGGLGNQMFQYALLEALAARKRDVKGSLGYYARNPEKMPFCLLDVFKNISIDFVEDKVFDEIDKRWKSIKQDESILEKFKVDYKKRFFFVEESDGTFDENVFKTTNCVFVGYWQTEKYFQEIRDKLRVDFTFGCGDSKFERLKNEIRNDSKYVSVHIRRGDYLKTPELYGDLGVAGYYAEAMKYIETKIDRPIYVYFSDDIQWVKDNFCDKSAIFIDANMFENYQDWYDMCLMSCCANNIIANSSFSWWGAWLNKNPEKIVIAPKRWMMNRDTPDIWCEDWVRI